LKFIRPKFFTAELRGGLGVFEGVTTQAWPGGGIKTILS
jgi:hypothetical protein